METTKDLNQSEMTTILTPKQAKQAGKNRKKPRAGPATQGCGLRGGVSLADSTSFADVISWNSADVSANLTHDQSKVTLFLRILLSSCQLRFSSSG